MGELMVNKHIIDVSDVKFKDVPITLDGEVLLEKTLDNNGNISGFLTCTVDRIMSIKDKTDTELEIIGWLKYKHIINSF